MYGYAMFGQFAAAFPRQTNQSRLAGIVSGLVGGAVGGRATFSQIDDEAALYCARQFILVAEDAAAKLAHEKHPFQIHFQGAIPIPLIQFEQGGGGADGGGVDEDVKAAIGGAGRLDEVDTLEFVGNIGGDGEGAAAVVQDDLGRSFRAIRVQIIDDEGSSGLGQGQGDGAAQRLTRTCDQGDFIFEGVIHPYSILA